MAACDSLAVARPGGGTPPHGRLAPRAEGERFAAVAAREHAVARRGIADAAGVAVRLDAAPVERLLASLRGHELAVADRAGSLPVVVEREQIVKSDRARVVSDHHGAG